MESKKKQRTLLFKQGKIWISEDDQPDYQWGSSFPFVRRRVSSEEGFERILRNMLHDMRTVRESSYVTYDDFEQLSSRVRRLENAIEQKSALLPIDTETLIEDFEYHIREIRGIGEIRCRSENKNITFYVVTERISPTLLRRVASVEIALSRKYPSLSIEIEPVLCKEDIPQDSKIVKEK